MLPAPQNISKNGKKVKGQIMNLPRIESHETVVDMSLLDVMRIEDFLVHLKNRTENNSKELWKETCTLAHQLKASRELLSIGSNLFSEKASEKILDRLVESAHVILNADKVFILEIDPTGKELVVTHSQEKLSIGLRIPLGSGIEGDVVARKICANVPDVAQDARYVPYLDSKLGIKTKCLVCAPLIADGEVLGVILAINRVLPQPFTHSPRVVTGSSTASLAPSLSTAASFSANEAVLLSFIAANAGLALLRDGEGLGGDKSTTGSTAPTRSTSSHQIPLPAHIGIESYIHDPLSPAVSASSAHGAVLDTSPYSHFLYGGQRIMLTNRNEGVKKLWEAAYDRLGAERVSVFLYNPSTQNLICTISQDIEGFSVPLDKGIAGLCFSTKNIVNIPDTTSDGRHNKDADKKSGFTTRSLLCCPIIMHDHHIQQLHQNPPHTYQEMKKQQKEGAQGTGHGKDGIVIGVLQAVNKKSGADFDQADEREIDAICQQIVELLTEQEGSNVGNDSVPPKNSVRGSIIHHASSVASLQRDVRFARCVGNMILCGSVWELAEETESAVQSLTDCDFTSFYFLDNGVLKPARPGRRARQSGNSPAASAPEMKSSPTNSSNSSGGGGGGDGGGNFISDHISIVDLPLQIKQALQFSAVVDFTQPPPSAAGDMPMHLIPGVPLQQALVLPINAKVFGSEPGSGVLIIGKTTKGGPSIAALRDTLEAIAEYFNSALTNVSQRLAQEHSTKALKGQFHLINSSLGALRDYVVLLDSDGRFMACNKLLEELFGGFNEAASKKEDAPIAPSVGSQRFRVPGKTIAEGSHYTEWLTAGNSPELLRDVASVLSTKCAKSMDKVKFFSAAYPHGIVVDYQVVVIENPDAMGIIGKQATPRGWGAVERKGGVEEGGKGGPAPGKMFPEMIEDAEVLDFAVVMVIHIDSFCHQNSLGHHHGSSQHAKLSAIANVPLDTDSAHGVVDAATSIVNNVRNSYSMSEDLEDSLKSITQSLSVASRKLSIMSTTPSPISSALASQSVQLVSDEELIPSDLFEWNFNVLKINDGLVLINIIGKLFQTLLNLDNLGINQSTLAKYLIEVGKNYHDRPFHNLQHATCVTHFAFKLIGATDASKNMKPLQLFAILLSAVVHDVDHPGNTNLFEVNSASELALRYNDQAVLENHHCATAFRLMRKPGMMVLGTLPKAEMMEVRKLVISCVMATDMAVHFDLIDETKRKAIDGWNFEEAKDQQFLGKILLHAADLSNPVRPFDMTREWARRISMEFNDQVAREKDLGMPVLGFMMTPDEKAFCKNETGFASFVVAPMWRALAMVYPTLNFLVDQIDSNLQVWKESLEKIQAEEAAAEAAAIESGAKTASAAPGGAESK